MCMICVEFQGKRMTVDEARRAFREMVVSMDPAHGQEVRQLLDKAAAAAAAPPTPSPSSTDPS